MSDLRIVCCALLMIAGCSSGNQGGPSGVGRAYAPCDGEPGACATATRFGGISGDGCLCTYYCTEDKDCPTPGTGTATPVCQPYGDFVVDGHKADCRLPCDANTVCPAGMFCSPSGCIGGLSK